MITSLTNGGGKTMKKSMIRKIVVMGVILLFSGTTVVPCIGSCGELISNKSNKQSVSTDMESSCTRQDDALVSSHDYKGVTVTVQSSNEVTSINYHLYGYTMENVMIDGGEYVRVVMGEESNILAKGRPDLPHICRSIIISDNAEMDVQILNTVYQEYKDIMIAPSKGVLSRVVEYDAVPYTFDAGVYARDDWYPGALVELGEPYILRDFRGQVVMVNPFQYNPVTRTLRVYTDIMIKVFPSGPSTTNVYTRNMPLRVFDTDFKDIYKRHFLNFDANFYTPVEEQGNMLVITYDGFWSAMLPFVQWKNMKGIPTEMINVSLIGNTAANIKNYISTYYTSHGLTFVLLVGDAAQVTTPEVYISGSGYGASDPSYSYLVGSDHYPDLFVGRFSAQTVAQVETQVLRSIEYERYPQVGASWYHKGTGIASNLGPGDDNEYDWQHMRNIRSDLLTYRYSEVDELYDGSHGGGDASGDPTSSMVAAVLNNGRGIINYCGHGSSTSWGTTGFSNSNVNALTNDNMLPMVWSVACDNGDFYHYSTCFAEAWLRATHNGEPTGAIATFMSSVSQSWDPPMDAQDEIVDILIESYRYNKKYTFGGLSFNGCMHMNDQYGQDGYDMTDTWHVFGDPSLQIRTDTPSNMTVLHNTTIPLGATSFEVRVSGVKKALCAISRNQTLVGCEYTNDTGYALIHFNDPITDDGDLNLIVTAYNKLPYNASLTVITGPLFIRGDANGNRIIDAGDVVYLINYLYIGGPQPVPIIDAGDANDDEIVDSGDVVYLINYLYSYGPQPPSPFPDPGIDPTS
jgi:hypothetical protein